MQDIKAREVIAYATMPRIVPRLKGLFTSGFGYISYLMAQVYSIVRLIPRNHPYLQAENIGRFGIRHVVAEAASNLKLSTKNIDQFIIFFALLAGLVIFVVQAVLFAYALIGSPAMAASWFDTTNPEFDIAFNLLDQVFGVPDIYCSTSAPGLCTDYASIYAMPLPYHSALHGLFQFYSTGLLLIAVLIFLYFIVVIIVETAVTGTPFGQRFQNVWVPVRLVVAIGMLMPIQYGLNSGQYIILYTAKYGSGLATNGWAQYNDAITAHSMFSGAPNGGVPLGERYSHLALPEAPDLSPIIEAMTLVHACAYAYHRINGGQPGGLLPNATRGNGAPYPEINANYAAENPPDQWTYQIQPFFVKNRTAGLAGGTMGAPTAPTLGVWGNPETREHIENRTANPYYGGNAANPIDGLGFYYGSDIIIRFGEFKVVNGSASTPVYNQQTGYVKPLCGDIRIPVSDLTDPGGAGAGRGGADQMQQFYFNLVLTLWFDSEELRQVGRTLVEKAIEKDNVRLSAVCNGNEVSGGNLAAVGGGTAGYFATPAECLTNVMDSKWRTDFVARRTVDLRNEIVEAWDAYVANGIYIFFDASIQNRGWGGAGIWYNKLAEINGGWMDGVRGVPFMDKYPLVMEEVRKFRQQNNVDSDPLEIFNPSVQAESANSPPKEFKIGLTPAELTNVALPLYKVFRYWNSLNEGKDTNALDNISEGNMFKNAIHLLMGTTGLANIRGANRYMHPLVRLIAVGKGLVNSAIFNMASATVSTFMGGMLRALGKYSTVAGIAEAANKVFYSTAFLGLTAGFVLFYVLPFLPFLYFYFAVASWVKAIFEAMLGAPLWALAHLRIDGDGLPGDAASNGYFLVLEIFIRPILTVFGLIAAILIFSTQVRILDLVWDLVVTNAAGFTELDDIINEPVTFMDVSNQRSLVDEFFFTVIYTIVCYMLALASFKLIDKIPDNILRWAGAGVSSYGDIDQDQVESISRYATSGGMTIGNQASSAIIGTSKGVGGVLGNQIKKFTDGPPTPTAPGTGTGT